MNLVFEYLEKVGRAESFGFGLGIGQVRQVGRICGRAHLGHDRGYHVRVALVHERAALGTEQLALRLTGASARMRGAGHEHAVARLVLERHFRLLAIVRIRVVHVPVGARHGLVLVCQ